MKSPSRPAAESQLKFEILEEIYEKGLNLDPSNRGELIAKFLAISEPVVNRRWLSDAKAISELVTRIHWGLAEFGQGRPFLRNGKATPSMRPLALSEAGFEDGIQWDMAHGRVVRVGSGGLQHMFLTRVFELLTEVAPWLRVCQRSDCKRLFLFQRPKQVYCSDSCAQRVRMERFLAQRRPRTRSEQR